MILHSLSAASAAAPISVMPFALAMIIFGLGALISLSRRDVTWIDAVVMVGFGVLVGSTVLGVWVHGGLDGIGGR